MCFRACLWCVREDKSKQKTKQHTTTTTTTTTTTSIILTQGHPASSRQGAPLGEGFFPPILGGNSSSKESPVLPIPSYPALCRQDTTSWKAGRPRTHCEPDCIISFVHRLHESTEALQPASSGITLAVVRITLLVSKGLVRSGCRTALIGRKGGPKRTDARPDGLTVHGVGRDGRTDGRP